MRRSAWISCALALVCTASASAATQTLDVPLDRSGAMAGTIKLRIAVRPPRHGPSRGTVLALAGGPGQSSVGLLDAFAGDLRPVLAHRTLVVFDPRGVGRSTQLKCRYGAGRSAAAAVAGCARDLGARRAFYSTADSVEDVESVRAALGVPQMSVYGVSYGTAVALGYARAHPDRVDRLVLDSTVPAEGVPALELNSIAAMRRLLGHMCRQVCLDLSPLSDVTRILSRLPAHAGRRRGFLGLTRSDASWITYYALLESDLHPFLKASIPAALHLAARGRLVALAHLAVLLSGLGSGDEHPLAAIARARAASRTVRQSAVSVATNCADGSFPWSAGDPLATRRAKLKAAIAAVPASAVAPFARDAVLGQTAASECLGWPEAGDAPRRVRAALPAVPTLILSGTDDIRTPTENARALAAALPHATLLTVPHSGHAVLASSRDACAPAAMRAFFADQPVEACSGSRPSRVDPVPPALGDLGTVHGVPGLPGEVLRAAVLTAFHDVALVPFSVGRAVGFAYGTQGGRARLRVRGEGKTASQTATLTRLSYVHGVALDGRLTSSRRGLTGEVTVLLRGRTYGHLRFLRHFVIRGDIGGRHVHVRELQSFWILQGDGLLGLPWG